MRDFGGASNSRIQSFHSFASGPEEAFSPDLALLASLIADGSLKPQIVEHDWGEFARVANELRERRVAGKAIFRIAQR